GVIALSLRPASAGTHGSTLECRISSVRPNPRRSSLERLPRNQANFGFGTLERSATNEPFKFRQEFLDRQIFDIVPVSKCKEFHRSTSLRVALRQGPCALSLLQKLLSRLRVIMIEGQLSVL